MLTTSQIRNLLAISADIYNELMLERNETLSQELVSRIEYLRVRFVYESGRDEKVKAFVEEAKLLDIIKSVGTSKKDFILFNRYLEALVAYHRFYGGND